MIVTKRSWPYQYSSNIWSEKLFGRECVMWTQGDEREGISSLLSKACEHLGFFFRAKCTRPVIEHTCPVSSGFVLLKASETPTCTPVSILRATQASHTECITFSLRPGPLLSVTQLLFLIASTLSVSSHLESLKKILLLNIFPNRSLLSTPQPVTFIWIILQEPVPSFLISFSVGQRLSSSIYPLYHQGFPFRNWTRACHTLV